jgi:hypothetical protein
MTPPTLSRPRSTARPIHASGAPAAPALPRAKAPPADATPASVAGRFRYDRQSGSWWWSPEMFDVLGLRTDAVPPGTDTLLQQQHPDDRARTLAAITAASTTARPFCLETRVLRDDGAERAVVLTGEAQPDGAGGVRAVEGICVDITDGRPPGSDAERVSALQTEVTQLRAAMASRAAIEQAKGILMLLTSCGDQVAFDLLAHISSHTHRKVRDVAHSITESASGHARLPDDIRAIIRDACPPSRPMR